MRKEVLYLPQVASCNVYFTGDKGSSKVQVSKCSGKKHSENVVEIIFFWTWMEPDWLRGMHNWRALGIFHSWQWGKCLKWWGWESILRTEHILTEPLFISFKKLLFLNVYLCWSKLSERITRFAFKWWHNPTFASNCFSLLVYLFLFLPVFSFPFSFLPVLNALH